MLGLAWVTAALATLGLTGAAPAGATPAPLDTEIEIWIRAQPGIAVEASLVLDGVDVTATYCGQAEPTDERLVVRCSDLPDGTYDVDVQPAGDGPLVHFDGCSDLVAAAADRPLIAPDEGFHQWTCAFFVGEPTVFVGKGVFGSVVPDGVEGSLLVPDGSTIECVPDVYWGKAVERCSVSDFADYRFDVAGVEPGFVALPECQTVWNAGHESQPTVASVTAESWWWVCSVDFVEPTVSIVAHGLASSNGVSLTIVGPDGDVADQCVPSGAGAPSFWSWECPLATPGEYTVELLGATDYDVQEACQGFTLPDPASMTAPLSCSFAMSATTTTTTVVLPASIHGDDLEPVDTLPPTGAKQTTTIVALLVLASGVGSLALARRTRVGRGV